MYSKTQMFKKNVGGNKERHLRGKKRKTIDDINSRKSSGGKKKIMMVDHIKSRKKLHKDAEKS